VAGQLGEEFAPVREERAAPEGRRLRLAEKGLGKSSAAGVIAISPVCAGARLAASKIDSSRMANSRVGFIAERS